MMEAMATILFEGSGKGVEAPKGTTETSMVSLKVFGLDAAGKISLN